MFQLDKVFSSESGICYYIAVGFFYNQKDFLNVSQDSFCLDLAVCDGG